MDIKHVGTEEQIVDILTKSLARERFCELREKGPIKHPWLHSRFQPLRTSFGGASNAKEGPQSLDHDAIAVEHSLDRA
jgi:hypothetical protein